MVSRIKKKSAAQKKSRALSFISGRHARKTSQSLVVENALLDCVRIKAYFIWETKGKPKNKDLEIWLEAEKYVFSVNRN